MSGPLSQLGEAAGVPVASTETQDEGNDHGLHRAPRGHDNWTRPARCAGCGGALTAACVHCPTAAGVRARARLAKVSGTAGGGPLAALPFGADPALPHPTALAAGRYELRRLLGEGGEKRVYLARDTKVGRDVAVALLSADGLNAGDLAHLLGEALTLRRLGDHPHLVTVYDAGEEAGTPYLVSRYMPGGSAASLLRRTAPRRLPIDTVLRLAIDVCAALEHAHTHGIVHRDLTPHNVWLGDDGSAVLGGFSLAVALDRPCQLMTGMRVDAVAYLSPEQARGHPPDAQSDLYMLGAVLYELVSGRPPFVGDDAFAVIWQHINTAPVAPAWHNPELPRALEALILRLLAKAPQRRPRGAGVVAEELRRIRARATSVPAVPIPAEPTIDLRDLHWRLFVGRRTEIEQLQRLLELASSGSGALVMLVGEPGIGKSRLAEEFAAYARAHGAQVLTGRCYDGEGAQPYRPFVEALAQQARACPDSAVRATMGAGAPEIARLVPELRRRFPDVQEAPRLEAEAERLRLFDSITQFFINAAAATPTVLVLDDLHWADKPSLRLLLHLARAASHARILVVGTYRDVDLDRTRPLASMLVTLRRELAFERIVLRGFPREDVVALLNSVDFFEAGSATHQAFATALYQQTEGNPLFIREVLTHLVEEGKLYRDGGRWRTRVTSVEQLGIPEGVREVISRRLSRVSTGCNRMLRLAATMMGGFTWEALRAISEEDEAALLEVLEEALRARLIHERASDRTGRYEFTHALIRQTLYEELSTPRRVLMHRKIGEKLEQVYGDHVERHLPELAHHFYQAAPGGDVEKAIDYERRAGDRAATLCAWEDAARHYERALCAVDLLPQPDDTRRCELLLVLAAARSSAAEYQAALDVYRQAADIARRAGAAEQLARAAIGYEATRRFISYFDAALSSESRSLLEECLERLEPVDSVLRAEALARLASALYAVRRADRRLSLSRQAIAMARAVGDPHALATVLVTAMWAQWGPENVEARRAAACEIVQLTRETGDKNGALFGHGMLLGATLELGDMRTVDEQIEAFARLAGELRMLQAQIDMLWAQSMRLLLQGRFDEAEPAIYRTLAAGQRTQSQVHMINFGSQLIDLRHLQGRLQEVEPLVRDTLDQHPDLLVYRCLLAFVYAETNREPEARQEFQRLAANEFGDLPMDASWLISMYLLTETCWFLEDTYRATRLYDLMLPYAGRNIVAGEWTLCTGSASRQLGMMATLMANWAEAERHFEDAMSLDTRMGARPWVAHDQFYFADMLLRRNRLGDRQRALELLRHARSTAEELGMRKIVERVLAHELKAQQTNVVDGSARRGRRASFRPQGSMHDAVTLLFSDMEGFTRMTERLGDLEARRVIAQHNRIVREQLATYGGVEVELQGDGFLLAFPSAHRGLRCAIAIQQELAAFSAAHPQEPIRVRIGVHTGKALREADRFFGKTVILTTRIGAQAKGGQILVSSLVKDLTEGASDTRFGAGRVVSLKGLRGRYKLYPIEWTIEPGGGGPTSPYPA